MAKQHWARTAIGLTATAYLLYLGIDAIVSRVSFSIATALVSGSIGRSFPYTVYGSSAVIMGIGWISAAIAVLCGVTFQPLVKRHRLWELARNLAILGFLDFGAILAASAERSPSVVRLRTENIVPGAIARSSTRDGRTTQCLRTRSANCALI